MEYGIWCESIGRMFVAFSRRVCKIAKSESLSSSCPAVRMEQLGCHWTDFDET
jgi:hypothetical protein